MNSGKIVLLAILMVTALSETAFPQAVEQQALRRKQESQQRARDLARDLVSNILDVQIQQLEENGLKELPLYREIVTMKKNINGLIELEMEKVVESLLQAQHGNDTEREQAFKDARRMIRDIVMRLSIERQNLSRRLKTAELSGQVKRLIELQAAVHGITKALPDRPQTEREQQALAAIEDQRDVKQLYLQLFDALNDVSKWGGTIGSGAADGLRIVTVAGVGRELDLSGSQLEGTQYSDAARSQLSVLKGLRLLLEKLEETQGLLNSDRQAALEMVRELIRRQETVRSETKQADLADPEKLVDQQAEIRKDIGKLAPSLDTLPSAHDLLEQAKAAAYEAAGHLFEAKKSEAVNLQTKVLGSLAEIEAQLLSEIGSEIGDKTADELARLVTDLKAKSERLKEIQKRQVQASAEAKANPQAAAKTEEALRADLEKLERDSAELPTTVQSRLTDALAAVEQSAAALQNDDVSPSGQREQAMKNADEAVERAAVEMTAALDDARRKHHSVKIGEMARASESLERAAATEREVARQTRDAAKAEGLSIEQAQELLTEQREIDAIARKVAQGVQHTAPEVARRLPEAATAAKAAERQLEQAEQAPGPTSKPIAEETARLAQSAAEQLSRAAADLRKEIREAAGQLAQESGEQLDKIVPSREAVEQALQNEDEPMSRRLEQLVEAEKKIRDATAEQHKAAGRPAAAAALQLREKLNEMLARQSKADQAARDLSQGKANTPLDAMSQQQQVADEAKQLAESAGKRPQAVAAKTEGKTDPVAESLHKAGQSAELAAKAMLDGSPTKAEAARAATREALSQAKQMAETEARDAALTPAGKLDPAAQGKVGEAAAEAQTLASTDAPDASATLEQAGQSSATARKQAEASQTAGTNASQQEVAALLQKAGEQVQQGMQKLGAEAAKKLAKDAGQADKLARQAAAVDPGATSALRAAERAAAHGAQDSSAMPETGAAAEAATQKSLERAAANLNAREQRVRRDQAIAEALKQLAQEQQQAAEEIAAQSAALEGMKDTKPQATDDPAKTAQASPEKREAAKKLADATEKFAQAQRATGQGAEEVSGQEQVANQPIREALELASNLNPLQKPAQGEPNASESPDGKPQPGKADGQTKKPSDAEPMEGETPADASLGTGFVPNSPKFTAQMMAGREAMAQAAAALGGQKPGEMSAEDAESQGDGKSDGQGKGESKKSKDGKTSSVAKGGGAKDGEKRDNKGVQDGELQNPDEKNTPDDRRLANVKSEAAAAAARALQEEPWFAKLPPELRKAMNARAQRRAPRGYEERLQKYFESID